MLRTQRLGFLKVEVRKPPFLKKSEEKPELDKDELFKDGIVICVSFFNATTFPEKTYAELVLVAPGQQRLIREEILNARNVTQHTGRGAPNYSSQTEAQMLASVMARYETNIHPGPPDVTTSQDKVSKIETYMYTLYVDIQETEESPSAT